ncbi:MAG: sulfatase-like hydrolase/transferase [Alphaproteobacteria bacterium]|nr:sulfatase-like hydrolase/transferase [Alphaproteobacteria bacterium]
MKNLPLVPLVLAIHFACLAQTAVVRANDAAEKPNILFIFSDDQCFQALRALGNDEIETPNLDRLVRSGVTFTHAYNMGSWSGAVCVASRTMLNTGRFVWRAEAVYRSSETEREQGRWWSEIMKAAGYDTYMTGKWHVTAKSERSFDFVRNERPGMPNQTPEGYSRPVEGQPDAWSPFDTRFEGFWKGGKHWSEVLADDADAFLDQAAGRDKPFFMYLAFNAPHDPRQSPQEYVDRYPLEKIGVPVNFESEYPFKDAMGCGRNLRDEALAPFPRTEFAVKVNRQEYYAITTHMDTQVGRILDSLQRTGKADKTYIIFTSDHGLAVGQHGLMGKQNMFDHSVRVPLIVAGPGIPKDRRIDGDVYLQDVMPTTLELAGAPIPDHVEFKSLMPVIRGEREQNYEAIYGGYLKLQRMVRQDGCKLILYPTIRRAVLFDLQTDPNEMNDLADDPKYHATKKKLFASLLQLQKETGDTLDLRSAFPEL